MKLITPSIAFGAHSVTRSELKCISYLDAILESKISLPSVDIREAIH